jgi:hypothetical protein
MPALLVAVGWPIGYCINSSLDRQAKRRDVSVDYLTKAYRRIEGVANTTYGESPWGDDLQRARDLQEALADIDLLGLSNEQVKLAHDVAQKLSSPGPAGVEVDMNPLLISLRKDLRNELGLDPVDVKPVHGKFKLTGQAARQNATAGGHPPQADTRPAHGP